MVELTSLMFRDFLRSFRQKLDDLLYGQKLHLTNKEALRCFLLGMLVNIFYSHVASENGLAIGYIATTPDFILLLTSRDIGDDTSMGPKLEFFIFGLEGGKKKPLISSRMMDMLRAMLIADNLAKFLPNSDFPVARIVNIKMKNFCKVSQVWIINITYLMQIGFLR